MVIVFLLATVFFFGSCNARKKAKNSQVYIEQVEGHEIKNLVLIDQTKSYETVNSLSTTNKKFSLSDFEGNVFDPSKPAYREIDTSDGKIRETFHNFDKVKSKKETSTETKEDTTAAYCETNNNINLKADTSAKNKSYIKGKKKNTTTKTSRTSIWLFVLIFVVVVVLVIVGYFRKRNPKNWIK